MSQKIIIVDKDDNAIGIKERGTLSPDDIYRVSSLIIMNHVGEVLVARRSWCKDEQPDF